MNILLSLQQRLLSITMITLGILPCVFLAYGIFIERIVIIRDSERLFAFGMGTVLVSVGIGIWLARMSRRKEAKQRAAEERFRVLFEHSSDAHLLFDETGIIDCNHAAIQMLRCQNKAEVLALHPAVLSPEYQPDGRLSMEKCIEMDATAHKNGYHRFEWMHKKTDGEVFPVEVTLTPVMLAGKETLLVVWHDLTERKKAEDALQNTQRRLEEAQQIARIGSWEFDVATGKIIWSQEMFRLLEFDPTLGEPTYDGLMMRYHPDDVPMHTATVQQALEDGQPYAFDIRVCYSDGREGWAHAIGSAVTDDTGQVTRLFGTMMDITDAKRVEAILRTTQDRLESAQRVAQLGSWEYDFVTGMITWSKQFFHLMGLDPAQGEPDAPTSLTLFHPDDAKQLQACIQRAIAEGTEYELDMRRAVSEGMPLRWYHAIGKPIYDHQGKVTRLVGTVQDITERKLAQRHIEAANEWLAEANQELEAQKRALEKANIKLKALATTDGLTGIANHRAFQEALSEEWQWSQRYSQQLSVILIDVDKFKLFNDTFGHPEGDTVLKIVAQLLNETARETDFVARYGGEEFVVLLSETDSQGACEAAERFRLAIEQYDWTLRSVTASFGVATVTLTTETAQELIDCADKALYASKQNGRNCVTHFAASEIPYLLSSIAA